MNERRLWRIGLALPLVALVGLQAANLWSRRSLMVAYRDLTAELDSRGLFENRFDAFMDSITTRVAGEMKLGRVVDVNRPYSSEHIHVYVVRADNSVVSPQAGAATLTIEGLLALTRRNVIALPPNIVLVDATFLSDIMVRTFNDIVIYSTLFDERHEQGEDSPEFLEKAVTRGTVEMYLGLC